MKYQTNSPADDLRKSITRAQESLERMKKRGVNNKSIADIALALYQVNEMIADIPLEIANNPAHSQCADCQYMREVPQSLPHGNGYFELKDNECTVTAEILCPAVNAAGFISEDDALIQIPAFLRKQAD